MKKLSFGERITLIRKKYNISMTEMANTLGVVKSNISRYERGLNKPTIQFIGLLLKHYRVNLNWLFGENEEMILTENVKHSLTQLPKNSFLYEVTQKNKIMDMPAITYTSLGIPVFSQIAEEVDTEHHLLPVSGSISAGDPVEIKKAESYEFVPFPFYKSSKDLDDYLVFKVNGLSMAPEINHEDIVFIKKNNNWIELNNKIVAVMIQGDMTLKKLHLDNINQEIIFKPLNRNFDDIKVSFEMMDSTFLVGELKAIRRVFNK